MLVKMPSPQPFRFQTRIRFIDTDASGRIHYTAMFRYFESAEVEFLRTLGITYDMKRAYHFPRVHVECDYKLAIVHDDPVEIEVTVGRMGRSSLQFFFTTFKAGEIAARGTIVVACIDVSTQRATSIPDQLREKLLPFATV